MEKEIKPWLECRNAMYFKANDGSFDDIVLVKEYIHRKNGTTEINLRQIPNYQKTIYVHKPAYRKYQQKRVWAPIDQMDIFYSNEANLDNTLKRILDIPQGRFMKRRELCRCPYIYGSDISPSTAVKHEYRKRWPNNPTKPTVAVIDIETNVFTPEPVILICTVTFKDKAVVAVTKDFLGTMLEPEKKFFQKLHEIIPDVKERGVNVEFVIAETPARAVIEVFKRVHEWKPDFVTGWNSLDFDIPKILKALTDEGYDPKDVLSDPSVHPRFRTCQYRRGKSVQRATSGRMMPLAGYQQWHWLNVPASFFFVDSMCLYYQVRKGEPLEENFKLDTIMNKHIQRGKVEIDEVAHLDGIDRHKVMQTKYKIEYIVYNVFDCIGLEMLEEKLKDITETMPSLAGISDYSIYNSNPRLLVDSLYYFVLEEEEFKGVLGTVSDEMRTELDDLVPSMKGWIVTLPTERLLDISLNNIKEIPDFITKMRAHSADIDISSGYPNIEIGMNMSKDTTVHEMNSIEGLTNEEIRVIGLNLLGGKVNSISNVRKLYDLPKPDEVYELYQQQNQ